MWRRIRVGRRRDAPSVASSLTALSRRTSGELEVTRNQLVQLLNACSSGAKNLTCFHGLYAKPGFEALASLLVLFLNSTGGREAFMQVNRFYGDGLNKLEPKDVEAMPCPEMPTIRSADADELIRRLAQLESLPYLFGFAQMRQSLVRLI